jgi:DNA-binding HxlR family transcriptional regulator
MSSIAALSRHRWALPILAHLAQTGGSRFVPLSAALGMSRDALRQTLDSLIAIGLVIPNPGYGHPTRPEYILTDDGDRVAPACAQLVEYVRQNGLDGVAFKKWSLPTVAALDRPQRFGEVRRTVGATARALTLSLKDLLDARVVERRVHNEFPPTTSYRLSTRGRALRRRVLRVERELAQTAPNRAPSRPRRANVSGTAPRAPRLLFGDEGDIDGNALAITLGDAQLDGQF